MPGPDVRPPHRAEPFAVSPDEGEALWHLDNLVTVKATGAATGSPAPRRTLPPPPVVPPDLGPLVDDAHRRGCDIIGPPMAPEVREGGQRPERHDPGR